MYNESDEEMAYDTYSTSETDSENENAIDCKTAEEILKEVYSEHEWIELQEQDGVDLEEYVNVYNGIELDNVNIGFREFFALKNFKETGYMRLYDRTKESYEMERALILLTEEYKSNPEHKQDITIWRGETREKSVLNQFKVNSEYSTNRFMSASLDKRTIYQFMLDEPNQNEINIVYRIRVTSTLAGANISNILKDGEQELVILPNIKFNITKVNYEEPTLDIEMENQGISYSIWRSNFNKWLQINDSPISTDYNISILECIKPEDGLLGLSNPEA